jgi:hypothetical protein
MEKNVEDLTTQNVDFRAWISEQSHTQMIVPPNLILENREEHNIHTGGGDNHEGSGKKNEH